MRYFKYIIPLLLLAVGAQAQTGPVQTHGSTKTTQRNLGSTQIDSMLKVLSLKNTGGDDYMITTDTNGKFILRPVPTGGAADYIELSKYIVTEHLTGATNGSNTSFTCTFSPVSGTGQLYRNGILMRPGAGNDYTISTNNITTLFTPSSGDQLLFTYIKQ